MYENGIEVSADDAKAEAWRLVRIERVVGYICALSDHYGNEGLLNKIAKLHDHEGLLTVTWRSAPTDGEKDFLVKAWSSSIGDGADNVEHVTK